MVEPNCNWMRIRSANPFSRHKLCIGLPIQPQQKWLIVAHVANQVRTWKNHCPCCSKPPPRFSQRVLKMWAPTFWLKMFTLRCDALMTVFTVFVVTTTGTLKGNTASRWLISIAALENVSATTSFEIAAPCSKAPCTCSRWAMFSRLDLQTSLTCTCFCTIY